MSTQRIDTSLGPIFGLTGIRVGPSWTDGEGLDALLAQFSGILGHDDHHARFGGRVAHDGRKAGEAGELDVCALAGDEDDFLLLALADEIEEGVDDEDVADYVCFDLCCCELLLLLGLLLLE